MVVAVGEMSRVTELRRARISQPLKPGSLYQTITADFHPSLLPCAAAKAALRQKKLLENELDSIAGRKVTLETQVNAIESANFNLGTLDAMKKGADVLKGIHGKM